MKIKSDDDPRKNGWLPIEVIHFGKRAKIVFEKDGSLTIIDSTGHLIKFDGSRRSAE